MGNCIRAVLRKFRRKTQTPRNIYVLLVGLDGAGKTLISNQIAGDVDESVVPTMGFRTISLRYKSCDVKLYDLGGNSQIRSIWPKYYNDVHGLIYAVDASDTSRLTENRLILEELISHEHVSGKPLLLLANKQDVAGALDELDLVEKLNIESVANAARCPTRVETCSCFWRVVNSRRNTDGIISGYEWLLNTILKNYQTLDNRLKTELPHRNGFPMKSVTSSPTPSKTDSIRSNPFKPIHELLKLKEVKSSSTSEQRNGKRINLPPLRRFLPACTNKTTPMSSGDAANNVIDANRVVDCNPSVFQACENRRPRTSNLITLEPLALRATTSGSNLHRPITAPHNVSKSEAESIITIIPQE